MNKKFLILGIVMMVLFGLIGCDNGTTTSDVDKVIAEQYRGLWGSETYNGTDFDAIVFYENWFKIGYGMVDSNGVLNIVNTVEYHDNFLVYTEGTDLYIKERTFEPRIIGTFTSDTTFEAREYYYFPSSRYSYKK